MKTVNIHSYISKLLISTLTVLGMFSLLAPSAKAQVSVVVNSINVNGLNHYAGQYLTVYYGIGNRASLSVETDQITLREVKSRISNLPISNSTINVPAVSIQRNGPLLPYNIIVLVVHPQPNFGWVNFNRSSIDGEATSGNNSYTVIGSITKNEYEVLLSSQGYPSVIQYIFGSRVNINSLAPEFKL